MRAVRKTKTMSGPGGPRSGKSSAAHLRHHDHVPRARHVAVRYPDQRWRIEGEGLAQAILELARVERLEGCHAKTVGELREIGVGEVRGDQAIAVVLLLDALDVAEAAIVEHHDD